MTSQEIQKRLLIIQNYLSNRGIATIDELSRETSQSDSTTRRDVKRLVDSGILVKKHGYVALAQSATNIHDNYDLRKNVNVYTKELLSKKAASLINDKDMIYIESGTTLLSLAKHITASDVTVVTSDVYIVSELSKNINVHVISTGGYVLNESSLMIGDIPHNVLKGLHFNKTFTSPGGISSDGRITYYNIQASSLRRLAYKNSNQIILVAESRKLGIEAFTTDLHMEDVDTIVTDGFPAEYKTYIPDKTTVIEVEVPYDTIKNNS